MFQDGTVAGLSGPHLTNTALEIQYLTERFNKGKLLRGIREMQMKMHSLGRGRRGKPWLPQSVSGKAQCHHSCHDALHPPTLPPSLEFVAGGNFLSHSETNACPVHWIWIYYVSEFMDMRILSKSNWINNRIWKVWWCILNCCEHNIH